MKTGSGGVSVFRGSNTTNPRKAEAPCLLEETFLLGTGVALDGHVPRRRGKDSLEGRGCPRVESPNLNPPRLAVKLQSLEKALQDGCASGMDDARQPRRSRRRGDELDAQPTPAIDSPSRAAMVVLLSLERPLDWRGAPGACACLE